MPAHKKHPSTRKRRNKASTAATLRLAPEPAEDDTVNWNTLTVQQLRLELGHRELPTTGRKADLVKRLEVADAQPDSPDLPDLPDSWSAEAEQWVPTSWHGEVVRWWNDVWDSPMSEEWHLETDYHNLVIAAVHLNDFWNAGDAVARQKADAAFKKTITPLGLTPYDRRRLEWTIASAGEATDRRNRRRGATPIGDAGQPPAPPRADPRAALAGATT